MSTPTGRDKPAFDIEHHYAAKRRYTAATAGHALRELADEGLSLDADQADELRRLVDAVTPAKKASREALRRAAAAKAAE